MGGVSRVRSGIMVGMITTVDLVRSMDPELTESRFPDVLVEEMIAAAQGTLEFWCGVPFTPKEETLVFVSRGSGRRQVPSHTHHVTSVALDGGTPIEDVAGLSAFKIVGSRLLHSIPKGHLVSMRVMRQYEYQNVPVEIQRAAAQLAAHYLFDPTSLIDARTSTVTNEGGQFQLYTANEWHPTMIPEVDAVINRITRLQLSRVVCY